MNFWKLLFRSWFYFRTGYATYLAFLIGFASNIVVIYELAIKNNQTFGQYFPRLTVFTILALVVTIPLCISLGLYHMKRTGAYAADASVSIESNPYVYKLVPGKEQEVFLPLWVLTVKALAKVLDQQKTMTVEEKKELESLLEKANALLGGQGVGLPNKRSLGRFSVGSGDR